MVHNMCTEIEEMCAQALGACNVVKVRTPVYKGDFKDVGKKVQEDANYFGFFQLQSKAIQ